MEINNVRQDTSSLKGQLKKLQNATDIAKEKITSLEQSVDKLNKKIDETNSCISTIKSQRKLEASYWKKVGFNIQMIEKCQTIEKTEDINANNNEQLINNSENENGQTCLNNESYTSGIGEIPYGKYLLEFTKVDPNDLSRKFSFTVSISSDVKILTSDPKDLFSFSDVDQIEKRAASKPKDLRYFLLVLRGHIVEKITKCPVQL